MRAFFGLFAYTYYSVKNPPRKNEKGDVAGAISDASVKYGIKFRICLSPRNRHRADLAQYKHHLLELLSNYGDVFEVGFDGPNDRINPEGSSPLMKFKKCLDNGFQRDFIAGKEATITRTNEKEYLPKN